MIAYLVGKDGPHAGEIVTLEEGDEWVFGRDPDVSFLALEDPMVSRKHAVFRFIDGLYTVENLSAVNPTQVNGSPIEEPSHLQEGDVIQIGNNFFLFTEIAPKEAQEEQDTVEESTDEISLASLSQLSLSDDSDTKWMMKVISGPNQGAEFGLNPGESLILGKDPDLADIIFQDLSVSRQHAKIAADGDGFVTIEDMGSRNGVLVNGQQIDTTTELHSQDLIALGTTNFLLIDRERTRETIFSPGQALPLTKEAHEEIPPIEPEEVEEEKAKKDWKNTLIPTRHLVFAGVFSLFVFVGIVSTLTLFKSQEVVVAKRDDAKEIRQTISHFTEVEFTFNPANGNLFLTGHVLTDVDMSELVYLLRTLPFIETIENNVIVDELAWESFNALLQKNPEWRSVMITATRPGQFILRGYVDTLEEASELTEYVYQNFPFVNRLENQIVIEDNLQAHLHSLLVEGNFVNVTFQLTGGDTVFAGRVNASMEDEFQDLLEEVRDIQGVRMVKSFVIFTDESTTRIDLTEKYKVTGTSRLGDVSQYVLINGKILSKGDTLDGMTITAIESNEVLLEKEGLKYKIDYNMQ